MVDLHRAGGQRHIGDSSYGDQAAIGRGDRHLLQQVRAVGEAFLGLHPNVDFLAFVLVVADLGAIHQGVHRKPQLPVGQAQLRRPPPVHRHLQLRIAQVQAGNRKHLGTRQRLGSDLKDLGAQDDKSLQLRPLDLNIYAPTLAAFILEQAPLLQDGNGPRHAGHGLVEDRGQLAGPARVIAGHAHEEHGAFKPEKEGVQPAAGPASPPPASRGDGP